MALILEQTFPLGRFHATRWKQNPFEDPYGEWPPSHWRLLRALSARWFQYSRETGDEDVKMRDGLLQKLAARVPSFCLPVLSWRGQALRQYHPTEVAWTNPSKKAAGYKKPKPTLVEDHYRALPESDPVYWVFDLEDGVLDTAELTLLRQLSRRTLYFGRAESYCRLRPVRGLPEGCSINCKLASVRTHSSVPVLVADPNVPLDVEFLLAITDDRAMAGRSIPPGTKWYYAQLPERPALSRGRPVQEPYPDDLRVIQFVIGGRVFPPPDRWIKIAERFRGGVLKACAQRMLDDPQARYSSLSPDKKGALQLLSGKDRSGKPLVGHRHAHFAIYPDANGDPTRLICYRDTHFRPFEVDALLHASRRIYSWESGNPEWFLRLIPLPFATTPPRGFDGKLARVWRSVTPFVTSGNRHRYRKNGRERQGEMPDQILRKLLMKHGFPEPERIEALSGDQPVEPKTSADWSAIHEWLSIHKTFAERSRRWEERARAVRPGYRFRLTFPQPVRGPLAVGHSSHWGLGLFAPEK